MQQSFLTAASCFLNAPSCCVPGEGIAVEGPSSGVKGKKNNASLIVFKNGTTKVYKVNQQSDLEGSTWQSAFMSFLRMTLIAYTSACFFSVAG